MYASTFKAIPSVKAKFTDDLQHVLGYFNARIGKRDSVNDVSEDFMESALIM